MRKTLSKLFFIGLALTLLTAFVYWPVKNYGFVDYDDQFYVSENYLVQQGLTSDGLQWAFTTGHAANWHPLTWVSHMLDCEWFGINPGAHHLVNLLIHILNTILLLALLNRLTGALWKSGLVAALFALHPLHVESVAWIAERKDVLSGFFGLLSLWFYTSYAQTRGNVAQGKGKKTRSKPSTFDYFFALILFALGLMTKPMLVTLPFVFLLLDFWPLNRVSFATIKSRLGGLLFEKIPFFALTVASCVITFVVQKKAGAVTSLIALSLPDRIATALTAYGGYLGKIVWPQKLAALYPLRNHSAWEIIGVILLLIFISVAVVKLAARRPYALVGWLWYVGMLVPVIGLVQVGNQSMADRYTYLPSIGIFVALAWGAAEILRAPRLQILLGSLAMVAVVACAVLTRGQVAHWQNTETLAEQALRVTGRNYAMRNILAVARLEQGRFDEAIALLSESPEMNVEGLGTLASALQKVGRSDEAMQAFIKALELEPTNAKVQNNLGFFLLEQGRLDEAIPHLMAALKSKSDFPQAHYNLGNVYFQKGDVDGAISHYKNAVRFWPQYSDAQCNLGMALLKIGKPQAALPHVETAIHLHPNFGRAHHHLSEILFQLGRFAESEAEARRAVQLEPEQPLMQYQLALVLDAQKKWSEAEPIFLQVLEAVQKAGDQRLSNEIMQRLSSYRSRSK